MEAELSLEYRRLFIRQETEVLFEEQVELFGAAYMLGHTREYVKAAMPYREGLKNTTAAGNLTKMITDEILYLVEKTE